MAIKVLAANFGYTVSGDWSKKFVLDDKGTPIIIDKTSQVQDYINNKLSQGETVKISANENEIGFGFGKIKGFFDKEGQTKKFLFIYQKDDGPIRTFCFIRNKGFSELVEGGLDGEYWKAPETDLDVFLQFTPEKHKQKEIEKPSGTSEEKKEVTEKSGGGKLLQTALTTIGVDADKAKKVSDFVDENPKLSAAIAAGGTVFVGKLIQTLMSGKMPTFSDFSDFGLDAAKWALVAAAIPPIIDMVSGAAGGGESGGAGATTSTGGVLGTIGQKGIIPSLSTFLTGKSSEDSIVYDEGGSSDAETAALQRCLIRLGKGNLAKERANLQSPDYEPVVGVKIPGSKNYADDGRFGRKTLDAIMELTPEINKINDEAGYKGTRITDHRKIPIAILNSNACAGKTTNKILPAEKEEFDKFMDEKRTTKNESKLYKDYAFLANKNQKLHSVLMESLKKDLKTKRG